MAVDLQHKLFTVDEYHLMAESNVLSADERVELIRGEVFLMGPIGKHHAGVVNRLVALLYGALGNQVIVSVQNPVLIDTYTELQPDIALLVFREDFYTHDLPTPADTILVIEVSDSTLARDLAIKTPLYAHGGVETVWIVNLQDELIETYERPTGDSYQVRQQASKGQSLSITAFPNLMLRVEDILG